MKNVLRWALLACLMGSVLGCEEQGGGEGGVALEGRWVGVLESGFLSSGSTAVALEVERARTGEPVAARVVFGEGAPPAAPSDPEVGWPAGLDPLIGAVPVADGFVYRSRGGMRMANVARIELAVTELWAPWCALQTPYALASGTDEAMCLPNRPWTADSAFGCQLDEDAPEPAEPVDCLKLTLCRRARVCDCRTPSGCSPSQSGLTMALTLTVDSTDSNLAFGALSWNIADTTVAGTARVRLTRQ